ncbi:unnamed protein product [Acanthoscelides obtectus]|uniref:Uncharacterized protein n=1 Tax=Acanthoscelides obtectus TaxID=200917 RepID=A0A9P0PK56_ACAOB|nr:unnamed protein product [Acanthoscelides obtectus]CAK1635189.1 hypothetical protein AOBTE_LOCUS9121 [Acanthoscelides obtectus]
MCFIVYYHMFQTVPLVPKEIFFFSFFHFLIITYWTLIAIE